MGNVAKMAGVLTSEALTLFAQKIYAVTLIAYETQDKKIVIERVQDDSERRSHAQSIRMGQKILAKNQKNTGKMALVYTFVPPVFDEPDLYFRLPSFIEGEMSETLKVLVVEFIDYSTMKHPITIGLPYEYKGMDTGYDADIEFFDIERYYLPEGYTQSDEMADLESFFDGLNENDTASSFLFDRAKSTEQRSIIYYDAKMINFGSTNALFREINKPVLLNDDVMTFIDEETGLEITLAPGSRTYDNVSWHYEQEGSEDATEAGCCLHFAVFLIWCLFNDLGHSYVLDDIPDIRRNYMKRSPGPGEIVVDVFGGRFWSSFLNEEGNDFAYDYFEMGMYIEEYTDFIGKIYPDIDSIYYAPDSWDIYDQIAKIIDAEFDEWKSASAD